MKIKFITIILISLTWTKGISQFKNHDISKVPLSEFMAIEKQFVGGEIKDKSVYSIAEDLNIISFIRQDNSVPNLDMITRYVFSKKDSLVKEVTYELDIANFDEKIEDKQDKKFRQILAYQYLNLEKELKGELGKSTVKGELNDETVINKKKNYFKQNIWNIRNVRLDLLIEMSNDFQKNKSIYPTHRIILTYRVLDNDGEANTKSYIGRKDRSKSIEKKPPSPKFSNRMPFPALPECKENRTEACFFNSISDRILDEAKKRNLILKKETLRIRVMIKVNGSTDVFDSDMQTTNAELKKVAIDVLTSIDSVEPAYIKQLDRYMTTTYSWEIIIENNKMTNRFEN